MKIIDKMKQINQRNEARAYFNKNNSYRFSIKDYIITFLITLLIGVAGLILILNVADTLGINFSFFYILLGYAAAKGVVKYKGNGGDNLAATNGAFGLFLGMILGYGLYLGTIISSFVGTVNYFDLSLYVQGFQYLFSASLFQTVFSLLGIFTAYYMIRNN